MCTIVYRLLIRKRLPYIQEVVHLNYDRTISSACLFETYTKGYKEKAGMLCFSIIWLCDFSYYQQQYIFIVFSIF